MSTDSRVEIAKIHTQVHRTATGLSIECRAHPSVEAFFQTLSGPPPQITDTRLTGRYWTRKGSVDGTLPVYVIPPEPPLAGLITFPPTQQGTFSGYRLDRPGSKLLEGDPNIRGMVINMGFLRLQGLSEGTGVEFTVKGVFSDVMARQVYEGIQMASSNFVKTFMKPIHLAVTISTQEY